ncbi:hypothetical protein SBF1_6960004 [Candidatus Desulfosporosinus infrequens]|uniref:Uncharacterized protein n=1 Tax=Candidatus Desulfosporosinus infrequens TaxID=2043169 RepID=A0A2U3LPG0_9FIRM|nr:hypothetical protein SBF1_6960004 [Candidatus Desulfosporosinus infrequens]
MQVLAKLEAPSPIYLTVHTLQGASQTFSSLQGWTIYGFCPNRSKL